MATAPPDKIRDTETTITIIIIIIIIILSVLPWQLKRKDLPLT